MRTDGSSLRTAFPLTREDVHLLRVVVRLDLSRQMLDVLLLNIEQACEDLAAEQPTKRATTNPDLWTAPAHAAAKGKKRAGVTR